VTLPSGRPSYGTRARWFCLVSAMGYVSNHDLLQRRNLEAYGLLFCGPFTEMDKADGGPHCKEQESSKSRSGEHCSGEEPRSATHARLCDRILPNGQKVDALAHRRNVDVVNLGGQSDRIQRFAAGLLLSRQRRPADSLTLEMETHVNMVGDLDERNAFVHPIILAVEDSFL
jgi:hypothetical protein